ncbi:MAG: hypothetical protein IH845_04805 [Nanoarchaeota archaeon]|nr:hypothetical protein [Nanoarchaeota archaeon]
MVTPATARGAFIATANGALGGAAAAILRRVTAGKLPPFWDVAAPFIAGYAAAAFLKMPQVGAGLAAVAANQLMKDVGLGDNNMDLQDHNYANNLKQLPAALDGYGQPMSENEMYLQQNPEMYLQESEYQVGYAPDFASPTVPVTVDEIV